MDAGRKILRMEEDLQEMVDAYNAWARRCRDITRAAPVLLPFADSALATLLADWVRAHEYCLSVVFFLVILHSDTLTRPIIAGIHLPASRVRSCAEPHRSARGRDVWGVMRRWWITSRSAPWSRTPSA